ncbi:MAG: hypothetical protein U0R44_05025 [Candidatus Micrarchaeia archaeon]
METKCGDSYTLLKRVRPFIRGLLKMEPLIEVAFHGIAGRYSLPPDLEGRYLMRIRGSIDMPGKGERCFRMVRAGCSDGAQEYLSAMWLERFRLRMERIGRRQAPSGRNHPLEDGIGSEDPTPRAIASEITRLRIIASELLVSGALTSVTAQLDLAEMLRHQGKFETAYPVYSKAFHFQLKRVLSSSHPSEKAKAFMRADPLTECPFCVSA